MIPVKKMGQHKVTGKTYIFVCGDLHNLGDLKLLLQNLYLLSPSKSFTGAMVRRWAELPDAIVRQVEDAGGTLVSGRAILKFARRSFGANIVFGGRQLVRDNISIASQIGLLIAILSAHLGGGSFVTRGLGISKIQTPIRRLLWRAILSRCDVVQLRDDTSALNLADLLPDQAYRVNADMVFLPVNKVYNKRVSNRKWVVISPCIDVGEGRSLEGKAIDAIIDAAFSMFPNARLLIACHDPREVMDKAAADRLVARWPQHEIMVSDGYELDVLNKVYEEALLVVTNRLHALIFGILADAPVLAIEDGTAKVRIVAHAFNVPVIPCDDASLADKLVAEAVNFSASHRGMTRQNFAFKAAKNLQ